MQRGWVVGDIRHRGGREASAKDGVYSGDHGIGLYRAGYGGEYISNLAVNGSTMYPDWVTDQDAFGPISNNGR